MKKKIRYSICVLLIITFFIFGFPFHATGQWVDVDIAQTPLEGVEEIVSPIGAQLIKILMSYILGIIVLYLSAFLLQWAMGLTITSNIVGSVFGLSLTGNPMVRTGWNFISGIANMFYIIIFIIIAFAYILRVESFQVKKTLPRLIMMALFSNFSLVFVGMIVDIANILYQTIYFTSYNFPYTVASAILIGGTASFTTFFALVSTLVASMAIPFVSIGAQIGLLTFISLFSFPTIAFVIFQIACFFLTSGIFLTYAFLFIVRFFFIEILAILSPLAFLCYILPQTKKYWDEWFKYLVEWNFLGIFVIYFMSLGLYIAGSIIPSISTYLNLYLTFTGAWYLAGATWFMAYYLVIFIYLIVILIFANKFMPSFAKEITSQMKNIGKMAMGEMAPFASKLEYQWRKTAAEAQKRYRQEAKEGKVSFGTRLATGITTPVRWWTRTAYGTTPEALVMSEFNQRVDELAQRYANDPKGLANTRFIRPEDKIAQALALAKLKGVKGIDLLGEDKLKQAISEAARHQPEKVVDLLKYNPIIYDQVQDVEVKNNIHRALEAKDKGSVYEKLMEAIKTPEEVTAKTLKKDPALIEALIKKKTPQFILDTATKDEDSFKEINKYLQGKTKEEIETFNSRLAKALRYGPLRALGPLRPSPGGGGTPGGGTPGGGTPGGGTPGG